MVPVIPPTYHTWSTAGFAVASAAGYSASVWQAAWHPRLIYYCHGQRM